MYLDHSRGEKIANFYTRRLGQSVLFSISLLSIYSYSAIYSNNSFASSAKVPLVIVDQAQTQAVIKQVPLTGTVTSPKVARLSSEVNGQVNTISVDIGDKVKKGHTLLQLDREIEALNLKAFEAATLQAREELAEAKRRYESGKRLRKQSGISKEEIDQRLAELKIAEAALQHRQAAEQKQQAVVNRHTIRAPFSGIISEKLTEVGEWVETGKPVLTLIAMDELRIDFQVPQELYTQINGNSLISITLDALPGKKLTGKIDALVPVSDPDARTFLVRSKLTNSNINMTPGMSAQGMLRLNTGKSGVVVSRDAIMRYPDGRVTVWVINFDSEVPKVSEQRVKVGHSFDGKISIVEGLQGDAIVVVEGNEALKEGQTVRI
ncbi:efflux RND transporter periplasmic adaptor subunit, partial [Kaarinaea lacus]